MAMGVAVPGPTSSRGATPVSDHAMLPHFRTDKVDAPRLVIVRARDGIRAPGTNGDLKVLAVFFLVSPWDKPGQHLRILAQIAARIDEDGFAERWLTAEGDAALRSTLLEDRSILTITLDPERASRELIDARVRAVGLPPGVLIAVVRRGDDVIFPDGNTRFREGDRISFLGEEQGLDAVRERLGNP